MVKDYKEIVEKDIFELLGAPRISESEKQALILKMYRTIENRVIARIVDKLNENEIKEFDARMNKGQKEVSDYLLTLGINFSKLIIEESVILKNELYDLARNRSSKK